MISSLKDFNSGTLRGQGNDEPTLHIHCSESGIIVSQAGNASEIFEYAYIGGVSKSNHVEACIFNRRFELCRFNLGGIVLNSGVILLK